jgi:hypothetical protein
MQEKVIQKNLWMDWVDEWFDSRNINILNIYVLSLILVEHTYDKDKNKNIEEALNYIIRLLYSRGDINAELRDQLFSDIDEEFEILTGIKEMLFICSKNPHWLQSQYQTIKSGKKILLAKPVGKEKILCGHLK